MKGECNGTTFNFTTLNIIADVLSTSAINSAPDTKCSPENLFNTTLKSLTQTLKSHRSCNFDNLVKRNVPAVFDIFFLFTIPRRFLECSDDKRRCGRYDRNLSLPILNGEFDGDAKTFPVSCCLELSSIQRWMETFAISSPTFLGERPRGPILGAREDEEPTSPPWVLR